MSIKSLLISIFFGTMLVALIWTAARHYFNPTPAEITSSPTVAPKSVPALPEFNITALQISPDGSRVINCTKNNCQPLPAVNVDIAAAVTDGQSWFYYQEIKDEKTDLNKIQLKRTWINQDKTDLVIEQTRLVRPRGLYISPDNQKVAFWLDNISVPNQYLTELWLYDAQSNSTKLIAEKIIASSVLTDPRWNRASTHLWFLGETILSNKTKSAAIHVASIQPPSFSVQFTSIDWTNLHNTVQDQPMDINFTGNSLAYIEPKENKTTLHLQRDNTHETATINGAIPYLQWLPDGTILYVVQTRFSFTFWQLKNSVHQHIARYQGTFQSARSDPAGTYVIFNTQSKNQVSRAFALELASGRIAEQTVFPRYGDYTYIIHFQLANADQSTDVDITSSIDDEQVAAFLAKNISAIAAPNAQPQRFITTDQPNTIWLDYVLPSGEKKRILLTIQDADHAEWSISARYQEVAGEWAEEQGRVLNTPRPLHLYEWEDGPNQWILKETIGN